MDQSNDAAWYTQGYLNNNVLDSIHSVESTGDEADPLSLTIKDEDLVDIFNKRLEQSRIFYEQEYDLYDRRKRNFKYLFGRQIEEKEKAGQLKNYESKNNDNVLYEIERSVKPLAMSQLPDLIVTPGQNTDESKEVAELLSTAVNSDIRKRANRYVLGLAYKHRAAGFVGVIKCRWNPELYGGLGDYEFINVHYDSVDVDHTSKVPDADKMKWVSQLDSKTVDELLRLFPKSKNKFIEELKKSGVMAKEDSEPDWKALATPVDIREVWFTDYEKAEEDGKWRRVEGVFWKYKDCILGKMKNPYFDYEGEQQVITYDDPQVESSKRRLSEDEMKASMILGVFPPNITQDQVYHNYFTEPRKPFFFMTYDQWGRQPLDETTHLEQNIRNQDNLDKRGKQITETLNHTGHHIWSKLGGFKPSDIQKMDHNNPNEDYLVSGIPRDVHEYVAPERPTQQEFADLDRTRDRMYGLASATAIRGQIQDTAVTNNQIGREANYTVQDDIVEETINAASEWMAQWSLHMIKTRYTQQHFRKLLGQKGEIIFMKLHQDMVEDGMEVMTRSSGTDKMRKQNNAMNMAKMGIIDPLSFYEDMDLDDPEGRAARMITFKTDMPLYISEFITTGPTSTQELVQKLSVLSQPGMGAPGQLGPGGPQQPGQGQAPMQTQNPNPANTANVAAAPPPGAPMGSPR